VYIQHSLSYAVQNFHLNWLTFIEAMSMTDVLGVHFLSGVDIFTWTVYVAGQWSVTVSGWLALYHITVHPRQLVARRCRPWRAWLHGFKYSLFIHPWRDSDQTVTTSSVWPCDLDSSCCHVCQESFSPTVVGHVASDVLLCCRLFRCCNITLFITIATLPINS